jgi:hypothetical protein
MLSLELIQRVSFVLDGMGIKYSYSFKDEGFYIQSPSKNDWIELNELMEEGVRFFDTGASKISWFQLFINSYS